MTTSAMRIISIPWPGYPPRKLVVVLGVAGKPDDSNDVRRVIYENGCRHECVVNLAIGLDVKRERAVSIKLNCGSIVLWFEDLNPDEGLIVHEAFHAVHDMLPTVGIPWRDDSAIHEVYAYAIGSVFTCLHGVIGRAVAEAEAAGR